MTASSLRIALLSYRSHSEVGGQGVYVRQLTKSLAELGHRVTVFSGPPYPDLDAGVELERVPSLDLYRPEDPFRRPRLREFRSGVDVFEYAAMCTGSFPEPLTFGLRCARIFRRRSDEFDVVHDNQSLGYGLLSLARNLPTLATIHHPISIDRRLALRNAPGPLTRVGQRRWYSFVRMQARVARRLPGLIAVSSASAADIVSDFGVAAANITVVPNGVDPDLFRPLDDVARVPGRIVTIASSDLVSKGLDHLLEAVAKLRTERDVELVVVGRGGETASFRRAVERFGIAGAVSALGRVDTLRLVEEMARAEVAVVPSLYEGFSLPAIEAMSCGVPLVATSGGALKEVVGTEEGAGLVVPPGDAGALAAAVGRVLDDATLSAALARGGRERAVERFAWKRAALATVDVYRSVMASC